MEFSATQYEAISYGPSADFQLNGFCTFRSMQIPRLTEFNGGGKRNVANPAPANSKVIREGRTHVRDEAVYLV